MQFSSISDLYIYFLCVFVFRLHSFIIGHILWTHNLEENNYRLSFRLSSHIYTSIHTCTYMSRQLYGGARYGDTGYDNCMRMYMYMYIGRHSC